MWIIATLLDIGGTDPALSRAEWSDARPADQNTVARMASGDGDALRELYDRHSRVIYSLALRIVTDEGEAQDIVQEVFAQAWSQARRYDASRGQVMTWLLAMTRSRAIDRLRSRRRTPDSTRVPEDVATIDLPDPARGQEHNVLADEAAARLRTALDDLPLLQRLAIELAYYEGLTQSEIATRLDEPLGTVKTRVRAGLMKLREALSGEGS